jgi:hypothetical protein
MAKNFNTEIHRGFCVNRTLRSQRDLIAFDCPVSELKYGQGKYISLRYSIYSLCNTVVNFLGTL